MSEALVVILLLLWSLVLLPGAIRARRSSPTRTAGGFARAMDVLRNRPVTSGRHVLVPVDTGRASPGSPRQAVLARRRRVFARLAVTVGVAGSLAVVGGGVFWALFIASGVALTVYVALLLRWKAQRRRARRVVRSLPRRPEPAARAARQRVGVGGGGVPVATRPDDPWPSQGAVRIRRWDGP